MKVHIKTDVSEYAKNCELPLYLRSSYDFDIAAINGMTFLLVYPKE
jgi:hypothetical protein